MVGPAGSAPEPRSVIEEQPLRIRVGDRAVATLMHTPGSEVELAVGFALTEGIAHSPDEIQGVSFCRDGRWGEPGEVLLRLKAEAAARPRRGYRDVLSSCSLCGDVWMDRFAEGVEPFAKAPRRLRAEDVLGLRECMFAEQKLFDRTGASHAAALGDLPVQAARCVAREDLGRHNALDKAVGAAVGEGLALGHCLVFLSSRLSFEMVAKAARAGIRNIAGVSAPSAPAVRLARRLDMFLAGFARGDTMTVYAGVDALTDGSKGGE